MRIEDLSYPITHNQVDEKNFDVEKWRQSHLMDYFQALYMMMELPKKTPTIPTNISTAMVFDKIFRVTRLHIPNLLFKFYSLSDNQELNENKLQTLNNQEIFMSDIKEFNDPFDGKAFYYRHGELAKYPRLAHVNGRMIDDFTGFIKATSLTENDMNCLPMWAHYSNNHKGYCVAYNMRDSRNSALSACTFPVQYTDQRLDITSLMEKYADNISLQMDMLGGKKQHQILIDDLSIIYIAQFMYNVKQLSWQYEREYRCSMGATAEGMPFCHAAPEAIYIGMNCSEEHRRRLVSIAQNLAIPAYQMIFDEQAEHYELKTMLVSE